MNQLLSIRTSGRLRLAKVGILGMAISFLYVASTSASTSAFEEAETSNEAPSAQMIPSPQAETPSWPRWRGPSGQGSVEGDGYVDRWSLTENIRWKVEVPGRGNSSPVVWGDQIFLTTAEDGGSNRSVLSYSRTDGRLLWQTAAPGADPEPAYPKNGHASSTPNNRR